MQTFDLATSIPSRALSRLGTSIYTSIHALSADTISRTAWVTGEAESSGYPVARYSLLGIAGTASWHPPPSSSALTLGQLRVLHRVLYWPSDPAGLSFPCVLTFFRLNTPRAASVHLFSSAASRVEKQKA